jgi:hypothetical protein
MPQLSGSEPILGLNNPCFVDDNVMHDYTARVAETMALLEIVDHF